MLNQSFKNIQWISLFLIIYNFAANLANDIYLPSLPHLVDLFATTRSILQLTMTAWFAGVALPQLFFGPLTDRIGRRPVLLGGGICFLIATLVCGLATNVWTLIIARFFQGVGVCSLNVASFTILIDLYHYKQRAKVMNKINICGMLSPLLGPILGGYIFAYLGWRENFALLFILGLISMIGLWIKLPESNLFLNPHALNLKNIYGNYSQVLKSKGFLKHLLSYSLMLGGVVAYLTAAPFIVIERFHIAAQDFGYTQLPVFIVFILGSLLLDRAQEEETIKKLMVFGIKLVGVSGVLMVIASYFSPDTLWSFIAPMSLYALGFSLCASPLVMEVMSATIMKGSAAAFLGFGMAASCMLLSLSVGLIYNGSIFSIALLLFFIATLSFSLYFFSPQRDLANNPLINN